MVTLTEKAWSNILDVNLKGMFLTCKYVLPEMEKRERGSVINTSSAAALWAISAVAYKVSKAGVNALTHQLAMEYAPKGIRVNSIMMGLLDTPMGSQNGKTNLKST